jgi:predicted kinase
MRLVILMGLQASGKSTFRRERFDSTHVVVSKDLLRNNRRPGRRQIQLVEGALSAGRSVVVDNTNPRVEDRALLIEQARRYGAWVVGYYFSLSSGRSLKRNAAREGQARVPDVGVLATAKVLVRPSRTEGFDELYWVRMSEDGSFNVSEFQEDGL